MAEAEKYLKPDKFYHVYTKSGVNEKLFFTEADYISFLTKFKEHLAPVADLYAYCLLPGHFHFLLKIKSAEAVFHYLKQYHKLPEPKMTLEEFELLFTGNAEINLFGLHLNKQFASFFNAYAQSITGLEQRRRTMLLRSFRKQEVYDPEMLKSLILYIHSNPVHLQFVSKILDWKYLSYHSIISELATNLKRQEVITLFNSLDHFKAAHQQVNPSLLSQIDASLN